MAGQCVRPRDRACALPRDTGRGDRASSRGGWRAAREGADGLGDVRRVAPERAHGAGAGGLPRRRVRRHPSRRRARLVRGARSEEHTSELQSRPHLVCRLLLEKKKKNRKQPSKEYKKKNQKIA